MITYAKYFLNSFRYKPIVILESTIRIADAIRSDLQ
jgi:hypothetical protein